MLRILIPASERYNEIINEFVTSKEQTLQLEHSLVSLSKWESKWNKPFLTKNTKSSEETIDYIRCMTMTQNVDPLCYLAVTNANIEEVSKYIEASMTATTFSNNSKTATGSKEVITAEIIYYWMITLNIPFECEKWHLNRLLTLINVCSIKNQPAKKTSAKDIAARNRALNESRRAALNTTG